MIAELPFFLPSGASAEHILGPALAGGGPGGSADPAGPAGQVRLGKDVRASGRSQNLRAVTSEEPKGKAPRQPGFPAANPMAYSMPFSKEK